MKYEFAVDRVCLSISIANEHLDLICEHDSNQHTYAETLGGRLDTIEGLCDTDYNGHFGPYIFVKIDFPDDTSQTREKIEKTINDYAIHAILTLIFPEAEEE
jgi:hypothetical protein